MSALLREYRFCVAARISTRISCTETDVHLLSVCTIHIPIACSRPLSLLTHVDLADGLLHLAGVHLVASGRRSCRPVGCVRYGNLLMHVCSASRMHHHPTVHLLTAICHLFAPTPPPPPPFSS